MYTERERIWIDLSDIFCEDESYLTIVAEKIMAYCTYTIEKIKYIFFMRLHLYVSFMRVLLIMDLDLMKKY